MKLGAYLVITGEDAEAPSDLQRPPSASVENSQALAGRLPRHRRFLGRLWQRGSGMVTGQRGVARVERQRELSDLVCTIHEPMNAFQAACYRWKS